MMKMEFYKNNNSFCEYIQKNYFRKFIFTNKYNHLLSKIKIFLIANCNIKNYYKFSKLHKLYIFVKKTY